MASVTSLFETVLSNYKVNKKIFKTYKRKVHEKKPGFNKKTKRYFSKFFTPYPYFLIDSHYYKLKRLLRKEAMKYYRFKKYNLLRLHLNLTTQLGIENQHSFLTRPKKKFKFR